MMKVRWGIAFVLLVIGLILVTGCDSGTLDIGELQTDSTTIDLGDEQEVAAEITMGAGRLLIDGGSDALLEAQFTYNVVDWKPEVSYEVSDGTGRLKVDQPDARQGLSFDLDELRYEWDLRLNDDVPMDLLITVGAGDSQLVLNSLSLNSLEFESGAGDIVIDLRGSTLRELDVRMGAGDVEVDLSGNWQQDLSASIKGGVGRATVILPASTGVRASVQGGLGQVNAEGLNKDGGIYTNDAYGQSDVTLDIDIEGGVGEINLVLAE